MTINIPRKSGVRMNALRHGYRSVEFREAMRVSKQIIKKFEKTMMGMDICAADAKHCPPAERRAA
jgi:hypothetical protein